MCRLGGRAAIDSGSHGGGGGLVGGSARPRFLAFWVFWAGADEPQTRDGRVGGLWGRPRAKQMD